MLYDCTFFCNFPEGNRTKHGQELKLEDIGRWIVCFKFIHPECQSISVKVWFHDQDEK